MHRVQMLTFAFLLAASASTMAGKRSSTAYQIEIRIDYGSDWDGTYDLGGRLHAAGALADSGPVATTWFFDEEVIHFSGREGSYTILLTNIRQVGTTHVKGMNKTWAEFTAAFELVGGSGAYEGLSTAGIATGAVEPVQGDFGVSWGKETWVLEGDLGG